MSLPVLTDRLWFPPVDEAMSDGLLALGGELSQERLLLAYRQGIFPWFEGEMPMWWAPDPRFVLFPDELKVSKSMKAVFKKNTFRFTVNKDFAGVIQSCQQIRRPDQESTWITDKVVRGYTDLFKSGYALSAEAWQDGQLVGGLYGVWLGNVFFGESMFARRSNASKFAFISLVEQLKHQGVKIIDCQAHTSHLESLGARMISRYDFMRILDQQIKASGGMFKMTKENRQR